MGYRRGVDKPSLRKQLLDKRGARSKADRELIAQAIAAHVLALPEIAMARTVACYVSMESEPGTTELIADLHNRGIRVLVPHGQSEPNWVDITNVNLRLGPEAIQQADFLIVPGLAVDHQGIRLGRGGGFYDRVLAEVDKPSCVLLFSNEVLPDIPNEPHDQRVHMVATELGVARLSVS